MLKLQKTKKLLLIAFIVVLGWLAGTQEAKTRPVTVEYYSTWSLCSYPGGYHYEAHYVFVNLIGERSSLVIQMGFGSDGWYYNIDTYGPYVPEYIPEKRINSLATTTASKYSAELNGNQVIINSPEQAQATAFIWEMASGKLMTQADLLNTSTTIPLQNNVTPFLLQIISNGQTVYKTALVNNNLLQLSSEAN